MHNINDQNLATYRYKQKQNSESHSEQLLIMSSRILSQKHFVQVSNLLCSNALHFLFTAHLPIRKTYFQLPRL